MWFLKHNNPQTHDYRWPETKHALIFHHEEDHGQRVDVTGYGKDIRVRDYFILAHPDSPLGSRYRVEALRYSLGDPLYFEATLRFAPRAPGELPRGLRNEEYMLS